MEAMMAFLDNHKNQIKIYSSACFSFEDNTLFQDKLYIQMIGKHESYEMRTEKMECVSRNENFVKKQNEINYCCMKGCKQQQCFDKDAKEKCVDPTQQVKYNIETYQDKNVEQYKQSILNQNKYKYIGVDKTSKCLKRNQNVQEEYLNCFSEQNNNICIDEQNKYCLSISKDDKGPIGKTTDNYCVYKGNYYKSIKYCYQDFEVDYKSNYCKYYDQTRTIDQGQQICVNLDENQFGDKIRGQDKDGNCITSENDISFMCSIGYCKLKSTSKKQYQCVKLQIEQQNTISSFGFFRYCGGDDKQWAVGCTAGYCIQKLKQINERENLFYQDEFQKKNSQYKDTQCVKMRQDNFTWQQCVSLDSKDDNKQVKLEDHTCSSYISQYTDKQNLSSIRCSLDYQNQMCLYQENSSLPKCRYFKQYTFQTKDGNITQTSLESLQFIGRAYDNDKCLRLSATQKSIYCDSRNCLNKQQTCQAFDLILVGKDQFTNCLEERDMKSEAVLCENSHCLTSKSIQKNVFEDRDEYSKNSQRDQLEINLGELNYESYEAKNNRILKKSNKDKQEQNNKDKNKNDSKKENKNDNDKKDNKKDDLFFCERVSKQNNIIGVDKSKGQCIYLNEYDKDAQNCIMGEYCLQIVNGKGQCVSMDTDKIICTDEKQNCLEKDNVKNCKMCKKGQCLDLTNQENPCLNFNTVGSDKCMGFDGTCQKLDSRNCRACPQGTCLDLRQRACIQTNKFKLKPNQCLKFVNVDVPCQTYDLNNYKNDDDIQCTDPYGRCINMFDKASVCQQCPQFYNQPGDNKCYGLKEQNDILNGNSNNNNKSFLGLDVIYKNLSQCPKGCYKCTDNNWCTQCEDEYILYRNYDLKIQNCIYVNITNKQVEINELNFKTNKQQKIRIQCDISSLYPPRREFVYKQDFFYCYYFVIMYQEEGIIRLAKLFEETIILQLSSDQSSLAQLSNENNTIKSQCQPGCITCQVKGSQSICLKCQDGFTLDFKINQCQKCPDQCLTCFYGGLYNLQTINWSIDQITLKSLDIFQLSKEQYRLVCDQCEPNKRLVLKQDFSSCELCGDNCNICSWGNQNYNLTNLFDLNLDLYSGDSFLKIKKCVSCIDGFIFNIDQISCVKKLQEDCLDEIFFESSIPLTKQNFIYEMSPFTTNQWFFTSSSNTYAQGCLMCNQTTSILTFQQDAYATICTKQDLFERKDLNNYYSNCKAPILYVTYPENNNNPVIKPSSYEMITCYECLQNYSYDFNTNKCNIVCNSQIYGCEKCYNYKNNYNTLFQCTKCENDLTPTQGGCQECPDGCESCFEGDSLINFTRQIVIMRPQNSLDQRLAQLNSQDISMICTSCSDSYYFDYNKKKCVSVECGEYCFDCYQYKKQSRCLKCDNQKLKKKISSILGYITDFYFQKIMNNIDQMVNYNEEYNDCFICPLSCNGCQYYQLTNNPLSLYTAKCLGCNQNIKDIKISDDYHWRFDQKNKKCLLCKKDDIGCYYEKKTEVYVTCGSKGGAIGQGLASNPYNLQRAGEINWDKVIVNEVDFLRAVVIYNEIGLQKIDVSLNFIPSSITCQIYENVIIESNLMQKIFTLKEFVLTLQTFNTSNPDQTDITSKVLLGRQIKFVGFTDINIQRIDWNLILEDLKPTGFIFDTPYIKSVQIINTTFSNPSGLNIYYKNLFDLQIFNLQKQLIIQNTTFTNFTYQNFELIKMYQKSYYDMKNQIDLNRFDQFDSLNLTLNNLCLQNNTFKSSSFMSFSSKKIFLKFEDSLLLNNYLGQNSIFFLLDGKENIAIISLWSNIMILKNVLESQFSFYAIQTFIRNEKKNIQFQENNITSTNIKQGIFQANKLLVYTLYLTRNTINNQNIFTYLPQKRTKMIYDPEYEDLDKQWEPIIDKFYDQDSKLAGSEKILFQLFDIYFQTNTMSRDGPLLLEFIGQSNTIGKVNLRGIIFSCDNTLSQNQFQNIFQIKRIYQLFVDRMVICNNENSKFMVLNDINIVNIKFLDIKQEVDKNMSIRYPQIIIQNVNKYIYLRNIFMKKLLIQTCLIQITINTENQVNLNILNFEGQDNQLSIFDQSEEVNLISIASQSFLNILIRSSKLENNSLISKKKIFKYSSNGLLINSEQSTVIVQDTSFNNNNALQGYSQLIIIAKQIQIEGCSFLNSNFLQKEKSNILTEIQGGAFYSQSTVLKIQKSSFTNSFSAKGGAIFWQPRYDALLSLNDTEFKNNIAQIENKYSEGGAIYIQSGNQNQLDISLNQVNADNNLSNQKGGFLSMSYSHRKVAVLIKKSQFSNNFAINGGIIYLDPAVGSKGYLILDQVQIFFNLNIFANIIKGFINNANNIKTNELSYVSFRNLNSVEFKEVSVNSSPQKSIDQNILINQILYQPFVQFQFSNSFLAIQCVFSDVVVFQTFIEIIQSRSIFIQQTQFLNIQSLKQYYINSIQKYDGNESIKYKQQKQDYFLNVISDAQYYQQKKSSLVILDAINIIQINQSTFQNIICPDCYFGPIFLTSQVATLTKNNFFNNQGRNGGAVNYQFSLKKYKQIFGSQRRLLLEKQIVQKIKTYNMRNSELQNAFYKNFNQFNRIVTLHKARLLEEYQAIPNNYAQQILIDGCIFQNNSAYNGGSLYLKNTYGRIYNSTFINNVAEGYGGAIFNEDGEFDQIQNSILLKETSLNDEQSYQKILYNLEILSTSILYNKAKKVGGGYYSNNKYPNMNQLTIIYRNTANQYGSDQEVSPFKMSVIYKGQQLQKNSKIIIDSGYIQDELVIYLLGRRNEQFKNFTKIFDKKEELEQVFLEISYFSISQNVLIQPIKIEFNKGIFNLTKKLQIFGTFGSVINVNLTCSKIKLPIYDAKTQRLISMTDSYYFPLYFQIADQCLPGTRIQKQDGKYDICQTCYQKTYSLKYQSDSCYKCPLSDAYCYKDIILIPQGYWRKDNSSGDISECRNQKQNCLGDLNQTDQNLNSLKKTISWQNYACAEGHIGALCEDCDLKAQYWIKTYQRVNMYSCTDCTQVTYNWIFVILSNAGQLALIAMVVFSSINYIKLKIYAEYLMKMKLFYFGSSFEERNKSSLYIKILINYFQIISCLSTFRIDIPSQINFLYKTVGNPLENVLYAQDCLLIKHFMNVDLIYYRLFVSHAQIVFFIICLFICLKIQSCIQKTKMNCSIIICAFNYCLYANLPSMVNLIIGTISCVEVGGGYYVKLFTSVECDQNHAKKQKIILWPLLFLWAVTIPLMQFLILVTKRRSLHTISMKFSFGFLYNEYSKRCFWWEIVKTFQKIIIILVLNIYESKVIVKGCIVLAIVFMQMCFSLNQQPFLIADLNKTDFISSIVSCLTISLGIILNNYNQSYISQVIIYILVAIINFAFLVFISKKICLQLWQKFRRMLQPCFKKIQFAKNEYENTQKRLKKLRLIIQNKIIFNEFHDFQIRNLQSKKVVFNQQLVSKLKVGYKKFKDLLLKIELKKQLSVKQGVKTVKKIKKRTNRVEIKAHTSDIVFKNQVKQKKQIKKSFLDMSRFMIKTQQKNYLAPSLDTQNHPQISIVDLDNVTQSKIQNDNQIRKEFQESQTNIFQYQKSKKQYQISLVDLHNVSQNQKEDKFRKQYQESLATTISQNQSNKKEIETSYEQQANLPESQNMMNSINVKRKCILSMNIENFTQEDIQSYNRIKNLKYTAYTEKQCAKLLFKQINKELNDLQQEYKDEQIVLQHLSNQSQILKNFFDSLYKIKQYTYLVCTLEHIQQYMKIQFNLY
ncbi:transmembrane protein, putative (macronuclear) [Tetrahymena thermophila SB210]|uniref:Transmembrane protein, putative n=1 Tax=Tetrahymena thermophila (strain SB210) TaxID=312017 RepID=Q23AX2_TETTS|nr:transmembrane protein, putative [Tetrahymena thermophila SB210]EAR93712.2 transmembrane protein, putative [Tetrahymena thermophila SB210]|eukprot:XP_001013957.2 transmembrane protein, putative [Tetrahymena thermophila SB210]